MCLTWQPCWLQKLRISLLVYLSFWVLKKTQCCLQLIVLLRWFISNCSGNENLLKLTRGEVYDMLIVNTETKVAVYLVIIYKTCIVVVQRCLFPSSQTCHFWKHARKNVNIISCRMIFLLFSDDM